MRRVLLALCLAPCACAEDPPTLCEALPGTAFESVESFGCGPLGPLCTLPLYFASDGVVHAFYGDFSASSPYTCEGTMATASLLDEDVVFTFDASGEHVLYAPQDIEYVRVDCTVPEWQRSDACAFGASREP